MRRTLTPPTPHPARLPRFLRRRRPVPLRVLAALCAALSAPVTAPALLATGSTALLAASAPSPAWAGTNQSSPVPGIGVIVKKNPGAGTHKTVTNQDGRYNFGGLEPGTYDLLIDGQPPRQVMVGKDGRLSGVITRPAKPTGPKSAEPAPNAALVRGGPGALQPAGPAASDIRSVPTTNPTPVPKGAALAAPPAAKPTGQAKGTGDINRDF